MERGLRRFLYLDSVGIHSLYTQLRDFNERERRTTNQKSKSASGKGRFSLKALAGIFGATSEAEMSHIRSSEMLTEQILVKETEQKLEEVKTSLDEMSDLMKVDKVEDIAKLSSEQLPVFIKGRLSFSTQGLYSEDIVEEAIKSQNVALELDQSSLSEDYSLWPHILMGGSLCKFESARKSKDGTYKIGQTSHLAVILRGLQRSAGDLGVFGQVQKTGANLYIKPYAIWS